MDSGSGVDAIKTGLKCQVSSEQLYGQKLTNLAPPPDAIPNDTSILLVSRIFHFSFGKKCKSISIFGSVDSLYGHRCILFCLFVYRDF